LLLPHRGRTPRLAEDAFAAHGAVLIGCVTVGARSSVWFNAVLRGDVGPITVGENSNIQDNCVVHLTDPKVPARIGSNVLVGHSAILHGCDLEDWAFVGLGAVVMDGCVIESFGMLAAGALLPPGQRVASRQLWAGRPAKFVREITDEDLESLRFGVAYYAASAAEYRNELLSGSSNGGARRVKR